MKAVSKRKLEKKVNVAKATLEALKSQRTAEQIAELRGKKVEEL